MKLSTNNRAFLLGLAISSGLIFSNISYASSNKSFSGIPIQGALNSMQLTQLTTQDDEENDAEMQGQIKISWLQSFQDNTKLAQIKQDEAVALGNKTGLGQVIQAKLDEDEGYLVWELGMIGNHGNLMKLTLDAGNGNALKLEVKDQEDED
ncbi:PepSY domain-containing protein [Hydrogenovibrio marinus]|uniref:PepSY domain-containing protein n=1 Tax=Hydrogenovibrio marinus TaxID=28885 RepID=A0A067A287_HYDMR|nr:PepSY domain-containing protein [Hydrogenovibrio marinus]KDN96701.1 hypothetical protein EI16_10655 [Hydrogenovibrio marinus]BBN58938.1 hypothetical protein HVMH_0532 [Hydrogenovibrio marinus]